MASNSAKGYLPTLDGWRAVAALGVFGGHFLASISAGNWLEHRLASIVADKGVDLFFGISGLLITHRLLEEQDRFGQIGLKGFYVRRFLRILPAAWLYLISVACLAGIGVMTLNWNAWWSAALFFRNYRYQIDQYSPALAAGIWSTGAYWSLSIEEHFYLIWPGMLVLLGSRRGVRAAAGLCVTVFLLRWGAAAGWFGVHVDAKALLHETQYRLDALLFPSMLAVLLRSSVFAARLKDALTPVRWLAMMLVCLGAVLYSHPGPLLASLLWSVISMTIPLLIVGTMNHPRWLLATVLEGAPLRWVGRISYSLYLWQALFIYIYPEVRSPAVGILRLASTFVAASLSFYLVEKPLMKLGHRLAPPATPGRSDLNDTPQQVVLAPAVRTHSVVTENALESKYRVEHV